MAAKYDRQGAFLGYEPNGRILAIIKGSVEALEAMRYRMAGAFAPPAEDQAAGWLAELDVIAPRRAAKATDDDLRLRAYLRRLAAYPADVVREALLVRRWAWFPSWDELATACDEMAAQRRAVLAELDRQVEAARERELRAKALPTEATYTRTAEEDRAARKRTAASVADILASMQARVAAENAEEAARQQAAADSYERLRPAPEIPAAE